MLLFPVTFDSKETMAPKNKKNPINKHCEFVACPFSLIPPDRHSCNEMGILKMMFSLQLIAI